MSDLPWTDRLLVADGHCDSLILRLTRDDPVDLAVADPIYQVDLPRLRAGGADCLFTMVGDSDLTQSGQLVDAAYEMCRRHPADFCLCTTASEVRAARERGLISLVLTIEGQMMFDEDLGHLRNLYRLGVRVASITHGGGGRPELQYDASYFGYIDRAARENLRRQSKGLTAFGRESLSEMGRLGIAADLAHINDAAFWEVIELAECPVCYTHGACYAVCPHSRALTDEMMVALAEKGGVMGIAFYRRFIDEEKATLDRLCDHFIHALEVIGPDHVGIGSDFDGTTRTMWPIPADVSGLNELFEALAKRGVDEDTLHKIAGENLLGLLPA